MKVVHVNTISKGGAFRAAFRIFLGLKKSGVNVQFLTLDCELEKQYERSIWFRVKRKFYSLSSNILRRKYPDHEFLSYPIAPYRLDRLKLIKEADVIHLHWTADFLDYPSFFEKISKPIVWTLHDLNPIRGVVHYDSEMSQNKNENLFEIESKAKNIKRKSYLKHSSISIVSPSDWILREVRNSNVIRPYSTKLIRYCLDKSVFKYHEKDTCRVLLGLPRDMSIILYVSDFLSNKRKGSVFVQDLLNRYSDSPDVAFMSIGGGRQIENDKLIQIGKITDDRLLSLYYCAADYLLIPSVEDNLPNVMCEALSCGLPVIGFPIGGIRELINDGENGYLSEEVSSDSIYSAVNKAINSADFNRMKISEISSRIFDQESRSREYIDLYQKILMKT